MFKVKYNIPEQFDNASGEGIKDWFEYEYQENDLIGITFNATNNKPHGGSIFAIFIEKEKLFKEIKYSIGENIASNTKPLLYTSGDFSG